VERDMYLIRKILLEIEARHESTVIYNLCIDGYDTDTIAYHCKIMNERGLVSDYNNQYADNKICCFAVGALTWEGHDYLDKIRDDSIWGKTKNIIKSKGVPMSMETVKAVATAFITTTTEAIVNSITNNGG
jgi:hypothetical protein